MNRMENINNLMEYRENDEAYTIGVFCTNDGSATGSYVSIDAKTDKDLERIMPIFAYLCRDAKTPPENYIMIYKKPALLYGVTEGLELVFERIGDIVRFNCISKEKFLGKPLYVSQADIPMTQKEYELFKKNIEENGYLVFVITQNMDLTNLACLYVEKSNFIEKIN